MAGTTLGLILASTTGSRRGMACTMVLGARRPHFALGPLRQAVAGAAAGDSVVYVVALDGNPVIRVLTLATLRFRLLRVQRILERAGLTVIDRYGVEPSLCNPTVVYQLNSAASGYADCCLRPRGRATALRSTVGHLFGVDPSVGAVAVMGRRS